MTRIYNREKTLLKINAGKNWTATCKRMIKTLPNNAHTEINSKWFEDLTVRSRNTKLQEKTLTLVVAIFLFRSVSQVRETKAKINK